MNTNYHFLISFLSFPLSKVKDFGQESKASISTTCCNQMSEDVTNFKKNGI